MNWYGMQEVIDVAGPLVREEGRELSAEVTPSSRFSFSNFSFKVCPNPFLQIHTQLLYNCADLFSRCIASTQLIVSGFHVTESVAISVHQLRPPANCQRCEFAKGTKQLVP